MLFADRRDAGRRLATALRRFKDRHPAVLALPQGAVLPALRRGAVTARRRLDPALSAPRAPVVPIKVLPPALPSMIATPAGISRRPAFGLEVTTIRGRRIAVRERCVLEKPFCRLVHFQRDARHADPAVLVVAPLSGHFAALLRDMLATLLPDHDLYLMDWTDAREVFVSEGDFGIEDDIAYIMDCVARMGSEIHLIGMCQSATPALAANALLAALGGAVPRTLTLVGGMIDTRISPTRVDRLATSRSLPWFERYAMGMVPPPWLSASTMASPSQCKGLFWCRTVYNRRPGAHRASGGAGRR